MACLASHYASLTHLHAWAEDHEELLQAELKQLVFGADARDLTDGDDIAALDDIIVMSQRCIAHRVGGT